jgi:exodeoxyribonuclease VII small subunit
MTDAADLGYGEAMSELEEILEEIERDEVDVDVLATKVARAAELIAVCRDRIAGARTAVERVVVELEEAHGAAQVEDEGSRAAGP